jgi:VanZ family protein
MRIEPKALPQTPMVKIDPRTRFALYATILFLATHWPALVLPSVVPVSDKTIHFVAWGLWLGLLASAWKLPLGLLLLTGLVCSIADEVSQAIPALNRHASVMDAVANVIGVVAVWSLVVSYRCQARRTTWVWMIISGVCFALAWTDGALAQRMVLTLFLGGLVFMVSALSIRRTLA